MSEHHLVRVTHRFRTAPERVFDAFLDLDVAGWGLILACLDKVLG